MQKCLFGTIMFLSGKVLNFILRCANIFICIIKSEANNETAEILYQIPKTTLQQEKYKYDNVIPL